MDSALTNWNDSWIRAKTLWLKVFVAANEVGALGVMIALHKGLDIAAVWVSPSGWTKALDLLRTVFFGVFSVIYLHFLWDMLEIFVPSIKRVASRKRIEGDVDAKFVEVTEKIARTSAEQG